MFHFIHGSANSLHYSKHEVAECVIFKALDEQVLYAVCAALNIPDIERNELLDMDCRFNAIGFYKVDGIWKTSRITDQLSNNWQMGIVSQWEKEHGGSENWQEPQTPAGEA